MLKHETFKSNFQLFRLDGSSMQAITPQPDLWYKWIKS